MRFLLQRVLSATVTINGATVASIGNGLLVFVGISSQDTYDAISFLVNKTVDLRIFDDDDGKMNLSVNDIGGEILVVSQFTLYGDCRKGRRPGFAQAAVPEHALPLYERVVSAFTDAMPGKVRHGFFGADMEISLINNGPVTFMIEQ